MDIGDAPTRIPDLPHETMTGGLETWSACQKAAQQHRMYTNGITVRSAALKVDGAHGWQVDAGLQPGPDRNGKVFALFGPRPDLVGWAATANGRPGVELLRDVEHF